MVERSVAPYAEAAVRSRGARAALLLAVRTQAKVRRTVERPTRLALHLLNVPALSDVSVLRREVAALNRDVRALSAILEAPTEVPDAARPHPARRRAQREARS